MFVFFYDRKLLSTEIKKITILSSNDDGSMDQVASSYEKSQNSIKRNQRNEIYATESMSNDLR